MKLLTKAIIKKLPKLYANDEKSPKDTPVIVKFFNPTGGATWWATEFDGEDMFFGFVTLGDPTCAELGYFSLSELESVVCPPFGLHIERDMHWDDSTPLQKVIDEVQAEIYA